MKLSYHNFTGRNILSNLEYLTKSESVEDMFTSDHFLKGFDTYVTYDNLNMARNFDIYFYTVTDENNNIVAIIKHRITFPLIAPKAAYLKDHVGMLFFVEVNKQYRDKHLLRTIIKNFIKYRAINFPGYFISNQMSESGKKHQVNNIFYEESLNYQFEKFFENEYEFYSSLNL